MNEEYKTEGKFCFRPFNQEGLWKKKSLGKSKKQAHEERPIYREARCWKCHTTLILRCTFSMYTTFMSSECVLQSAALELLWAKQHLWQLLLSVQAWTSLLLPVLWMDGTDHLKIILGKNMNPRWQWDQESARMKTCIKYVASFGENSIDISGGSFMKWCITSASDSTEEIP